MSFSWEDHLASAVAFGTSATKASDLSVRVSFAVVVVSHLGEASEHRRRVLTPVPLIGFDERTGDDPDVVVSVVVETFTVEDDPCDAVGLACVTCFGRCDDIKARAQIVRFATVVSAVYQDLEHLSRIAGRNSLFAVNFVQQNAQVSRGCCVSVGSTTAGDQLNEPCLCDVVFGEQTVDVSQSSLRAPSTDIADEVIGRGVVADADHLVDMALQSRWEPRWTDAFAVCFVVDCEHHVGFDQTRGRGPHVLVDRDDLAIAKVVHEQAHLVEVAQVTTIPKLCDVSLHPCFETSTTHGDVVQRILSFEQTSALGGLANAVGEHTAFVGASDTTTSSAASSSTTSTFCIATTFSSFDPTSLCAFFQTSVAR